MPGPSRPPSAKHTQGVSPPEGGAGSGARRPDRAFAAATLARLPAAPAPTMSANPDAIPPRLGSTPAAPDSQRVAVAHDYLLVMRGAERTFAAIADLYPQAPIFTLLYDERGNRRAVRRPRRSRPRRCSAWASARHGFRRLLPLYPLAVRRLRPPPCERRLSSSSAFAHGLAVPDRRRPRLLLPCALPLRLVRAGPRARRGARARCARAARPAAWMRRWDAAASRRVDLYVANSQLTRERIARYYGRDAVIVHPPVETDRFAPGEPGERLLVVSELVRHKRVHVALAAARRARRADRGGRQRPRARARCSAEFAEAEFLGRVDDARLAELYAGARAVIVPGTRGVRHHRGRGAGRRAPGDRGRRGRARCETVIEGETGRLVALDDVGRDGGRRSPASTARRSTRRGPSRRPAASRWRRSANGCGAAVADALRAGPGAGGLTVGPPPARGTSGRVGRRHGRQSAAHRLARPGAGSRRRRSRASRRTCCSASRRSATGSTASCPRPGTRCPSAIADSERITICWGSSRVALGPLVQPHADHGVPQRHGRCAGSRRCGCAARSSRRHATDPYDVIYQFSTIESLAVPARLTRSVPLVIHPETHAAGELRALIAERRLAPPAPSRCRAG